jgi:hypothetical protein
VHAWRAQVAPREADLDSHSDPSTGLHMPIAAISPVQPAQAIAPAPQRPPQPPQLPDAPKPVTPAVAAVHIMKVPASRIVEGFASLQSAIVQQARREAAPRPDPPATRPAPLWPAAAAAAGEGDGDEEHEPIDLQA